jgi:adenylate kinase
MRTAICTGTSGSQRMDYLQEVRKFASTQGREMVIIDAWEVLKEVSRRPVDEATILNLPTTTRMSLLEQAYKEVSERLEKVRAGKKANSPIVATVATHACFHWKTEYVGAFPNHLLVTLKPDVFVTIIHNMRNVKENLDRDASHRFTDINYTDILYWRDREITETGRWASALVKEHFIVARNELPQTLHKILFEETTKKIYFSYPMSHVTREQMKEAELLIAELRNRGYIVFDPGSIDDAKYVDELIQTEPGNPLYVALGKDVDDQTVKLDYSLIAQSNLVVVRYPAVELSQARNHADRMYVPLSAGVICEMVRGHSEGKRVYAVWLPQTDPSPFFIYHCKQHFKSTEALLDYLARNEPPMT